MAVSRRGFIAGGTGIALAGIAAGCGREERTGPIPQAPDGRTAAAPSGPPASTGTLTATRAADKWTDVREAFNLDPEFIHMSAMLLVSHPAPVREAIERHRDGLDRNPAAYLEQNMSAGLTRSREAAADYLGISRSRLALTTSTTMGVGLVYNGLRLRPGDEVLTTDQDYYVTFEALRQLTARTGATLRTVELYDRPPTLSEAEAVQRITDGITNATRLVALTWVHSSTGYKLPVRAISDAIADINSARSEARQILLGIDGVHGFGVEDFELADLGCDFFMAGCHKWLFGPRGTGIVAAGPKGYDMLVPSIPSFIENAAFDAWILENDDAGPNNAQRMTPGGFQAFEHKLALTEAFAWQDQLGKADVAERTHDLARQLKEGLAAIDGVTVQTPMEDDRSAGIVAFDVSGRSSRDTVSALRSRKIVASVAPYAIPHARLTPSIRNSPEEIEQVLRAVREIA